MKGKLAELGLAPEVLPLVTLAELLGVPVALLLDEVIQGALEVVVPWSLGRFEIAPFPKAALTLDDGRTVDTFGKVEFFDRYPGETPAFYVQVATVEGGSDGLYRMLDGGRVRLLAGIHRSGNNAAMDAPREPVEVGLQDLLVPWHAIAARGWAAKLFPVPAADSDTPDPTTDERTKRRYQGWVRRGRKILEQRPELLHKTRQPKWAPLAKAVHADLDKARENPAGWKHVEKKLRAHWNDPPK